MSDDGFRRLLRAYPGVTAAADNAFQTNTNRYEETVRIASSIMADLLYKQQPEVRLEALEALRTPSSAHSEFGSKAERSRALILAMEEWAFSRVQEGRVSSSCREIAMSEVIGALQGLNGDERSKTRIVQALEEAVLGKYAQPRNPD